MSRPDSWFRFYNGAVDNPKVQRLPAALFKVWVNLLCIASKNSGALPNVADMAFILRAKESDVVTWIATLEGLRLFDRSEETGTYSPHDWKDLQFLSDVSTERVKRYRERQKKRPLKRDETVSETPDVTAQETEHSIVEHSPSESERKPKGKRLDPDWKPSEKNYANAAKLNLTRNETDALAEQFRRYFLGPDATRPVKKDWDGAFDNWVARDSAKIVGSRAQRGRAAGDTLGRGSVLAARDKILAEAGIFPERTDHELRVVGGSRAERNQQGGGDPGPVIDADFRERGAGPSHGFEADDAPDFGANDHGYGGPTESLPEADRDLSGGRCETRFDDAREPLVARVGGVEGTLGDTHLSPPDDAGGH